MSYPTYMQESIERVEATRATRLHESFPMMLPDEKQSILEEFHPDYRAEGMREIRVGASKGQRMPVELADLMEGASHLIG